MVRERTQEVAKVSATPRTATPTTESANQGQMPSLMLASGEDGVDFTSVGWNSVGWNSVGWNTSTWDD